MAEVARWDGTAPAVAAEVLVIGAGAAGLVAALRARAAGAEVVVLERDPVPRGSTAMSSGLVPAAGTRFQRALGIADSPALLAADIARKAQGRADPGLVALAAGTIGPALEWLADRHGLAWSVLDDFLYPGHAVHRMHALPGRSGADLMAALTAAAEGAGVTLVTGARARVIEADADRRVHAVAVERRDGAMERIGCRALVLACGGYGGNPGLVGAHVRALAGAAYHGHAGNTGDALLWAQALGAPGHCLSGAQGHGSLAHPHGILITWALMMAGGIQIDALGRRFANEHRGYSEAAADVLARPGGIAWSVFDTSHLELARGFPDFRDAEALGAVRAAADEAALAALTGAPHVAVAETLAALRAFAAGAARDPLGRDFTGAPPLRPPYLAVRVTGALFHTQGGPLVGSDARVLDGAGRPLPNLCAAGGAACGVSGPEPSGYLSGNGLLSAIALGALAGGAAARLSVPRLPVPRLSAAGEE